MSNREVRVRFAPSPTGPLHMGGVRTALFNYLFAKRHGGKFILRIEDTDQTRFVPGAEEYIMESLAWCGISFDEGIREGGAFGPYRQSDRKSLYKQYSDQLVESGAAYMAFDTPEELETMRTKLETENAAIRQYNAGTRMGMRNSLSLSEAEVKTLLAAGTPYVVRFKLPNNEDIVINDIIRGEVTFNSLQLDDKVLFKSDGMPTYHLANVVDDYLMKISHVIRGEEWLPSMPLHVLLYRAFGWEAVMPEFAHLPLLLKPVGKGKLSKRDGDKMGFPVFPMQWKDPETGEFSRGYREDGYFAEAFVNLLALLGWNSGTEQEIFTMQALTELFGFDRVSKSGARFDPEKAKWFNHQYLQLKTDAELASLYQKFLQQKGIKVEESVLVKIVPHVKQRVNFVHEMWEQSAFFFVAPESYDEKSVKKNWKEQTPELMTKLAEVLEACTEFTAPVTETTVKAWIEANQHGMGAVMNAFRLAIVGAPQGPHMFDIIEVLGKTETLKRLKKAIETIK
ncbi:MAG TPA: glutamate--tRNA ligase [Bacteroidales bacterium]|nr:glutamate--tRNA ligase [Bacteroidales bacterium]